MIEDAALGCDRTVKSVIHLGVARSLETLTACFLSDQPFVVEAKAAPSLAIVFGLGARQDFRDAIANALRDSQPIRTIDAGPGITASLFTGALRQSGWTKVDVSPRAPRLRTVRLPRSLVESHAIAGASDLRVMSSKRPLIALGLWAPLASPVQRLGARVTGPREGLTAEIGLAIQPAALIAIANLDASGPLAMVVSSDPIATELMALALWQSRAPSSIDLAGPWEDPLVQRATELGLGVTQPSQLAIETTLCDDLTAAGRKASQERLATALSLIGVEYPLLSPIEL